MVLPHSKARSATQHSYCVRLANNMCPKEAPAARGMLRGILRIFPSGASGDKANAIERRALGAWAINTPCTNNCQDIGSQVGREAERRLGGAHLYKPAWLGTFRLC